LIQVILTNSLTNSEVTYSITPNDTKLAKDWQVALKKILEKKLRLEKEFCFLGFPNSDRDIRIICWELNKHIERINKSNLDYRISDYFVKDSVIYDVEKYNFKHDPDYIKHDILNRLHNHFEVLQGTVEKISDYYLKADDKIKESIKRLNYLCHELENQILAQIKYKRNKKWIRPSQITSFKNATRYDLEDEHRQGFLTNGYDRVFGGVYMHWCQIGKTYFEVFRDENAPVLTNTVCEAITDLKYYSGEFDIEWGRDIVKNGENLWHNKQMDMYNKWLTDNGKDISDKTLSLGYLPIGQVNLKESFGTVEPEKIWQIIGKHLNIAKIEIGDISATYEYDWVSDCHDMD
jgi:hypothetical protein